MRPVSLSALILLVISTLSACPAFAATIYVPADQPTIQAGIDAAVDLDLVFVASGTYFEKIDFQGKTITVQSEAGSSATTISLSGCEYVVRFASGETQEAVLDGFTIMNGYTPWGFGGGIYCHSSSPTIANCTITQNYAFFAGGGIYCHSSSPTITNCMITQNSTDYGGAGISCSNSSPTIESCTISENRASGYGLYGGGISCLGDSSPRITNCVIVNNNAEQSGGGIYCGGPSPVVSGCVTSDVGYGGILQETSSPTITHCTISGNNASLGGGIYCFFSSPTIENCQIVGNIARSGGGIYGHDTAAIIKNCIIAGNSADHYGGGIRSVYSYPSIINCTITGNSASQGGGIFCSRPHEDMSPRIYNSILWGDSASEGPEIWIAESGYVPTLTISFSDIQGGLEGVYNEYGWLDWGEGNIDEAPLFIGPTDYHLSSGSSCIDAGSSSPSYNDACFPPSMGTERNDMGAYGGPGACGWVEPTFTLELDASYDAGSLNLTYTVSTSEPAMWTNFAVLTYPEIQVVPLWTVPLPVIDPPVVFPIAFPFPSLGWVGIYTGLFTAAGPQAVELVWVDTGWPSQ